MNPELVWQMKIWPGKTVGLLKVFARRRLQILERTGDKLQDVGFVGTVRMKCAEILERVLAADHQTRTILTQPTMHLVAPEKLNFAKKFGEVPVLKVWNPTDGFYSRVFAQSPGVR